MPEPIELVNFSERYRFLCAYYWDTQEKNLVSMTLGEAIDEEKLPEEVREWIKEQRKKP